MKKRFFLFFILVAFATSPLFAAPKNNDGEADTYQEAYGLGDQIFVITAGVFIPLFFMDTSLNTTDTNLTLGGCGSLLWQTFLTNHISFGGEFGGMFALSPNDRVLYMIPLTAKVSYWFRKYPFEFPISLGLGGCLSVLDEAAHIDFIAKPSVGAFWNFNEEWAFGVNATYWFIPQMYSGSGKVSANHSMFGNFLETTASVLFRF